MACSVWVLASVTDQGEREAQKGEKTGTETSFSTVTQTKPAVDASHSMIWGWGSRAELLDHTLFEMSG